MAKPMHTISFVVLGCILCASTAEGYQCQVQSCCDYESCFKNSANPTCTAIQRYCSWCSRGDWVDVHWPEKNVDVVVVAVVAEEPVVGAEDEVAQASKHSNPMSRSDAGLVTVGALLIIAVVAVVGVAFHRHRSAVAANEKTKELTEKLVEDGHVDDDPSSDVDDHTYSAMTDE